MFAIPTLQDLTNRARQQFRANLKGSDAWLWPNNIYVSAKVIGGMCYEVFGFADYIQRQKFAGTADGENLDLHGQEYGLSRKPAAPASGSVTLTSTAAITVAAGATFQRTDGVQYVATAGAGLDSAGSIDVACVATATGKITNAVPGAPLSVVSGVTGPGDVTAEVGSSGMMLGYDVEPDGEYWTTDLSTFRGRILFRKRNPPHGGAPADYVMWCGEVVGVTRTFVERRWNGPGTIRVFPLMDDLYANGIPDVAGLARVSNYLETVAPAGAVITVAAPSPVVVDLAVSGLVPSITTVQEAALAELRASFRRLSRVAGTDVQRGGMQYLAYPTSFSESWLWQAIANASGEERHKLISPTDDIALATGQMAVLGTVSWS